MPDDLDEAACRAARLFGWVPRREAEAPSSNVVAIKSHKNYVRQMAATGRDAGAWPNSR